MELYWILLHNVTVVDQSLKFGTHTHGHTKRHTRSHTDTHIHMCTYTHTYTHAYTHAYISFITQPKDAVTNTSCMEFNIMSQLSFLT